MRSQLIAAIFAVVVGPTAMAQTPAPVSETESDTVTVWGQRQRQLGVAHSASEGTVDFGKFVDRPLLRVGELAEVVPGLAATQHSGTGKANQYFLRGFNLDHGTDFTITLDGIPLNLRTNAHGQGYLDINFLIPEIVERISYRKGVASADVGDFSAAGSASFSTFAHLPENFAQVEIGENNWRRFVGGVNFGQLGYAALDLTSDDGPWAKPEDLKKANGFVRFNAGPWSLSGGAYHATWNATDQVPLRTLQSGLISRLSDIDPDVGGSSEREWLNVGYAGDDGLTARVYAMRYRLKLTSNFTYFLDDPVNGDEFQQAERRMIYGGAITKAFDPVGAWTPRVGLDARLDRLDPVGLYRTSARVRRETVREDKVEQDSIGAWGSLDGDFGRARIDLGLRADAMRVDVASNDTRNSGEADDAILSPKASFAWRFSDQLEGYVSAGRGFHSNDARGATIAFDPATGDPAARVPLFVKAEGIEAGLRYERRRFSATASAFGLDLDSELVYVGDAGATEPSDASRRTGVELTATWAPTDWLTLDGAAAATRARFRGVAAGQDRIPLATDYVITGGATVRFAEDWTGSLTVRRLGPAPLIEDNSARSKSSTVVNGRIGYRVGRYSIAAEALNLLDSDDADITYFYASRLPGEPADGVEDIHFHPVPPRSFRLQVRRTF
jgi:hypothetical protein